VFKNVRHWTLSRASWIQFAPSIPVSLKFPEWCYCKHICVLTPYREGSPLKYSPWATTQLTQRYFHCWKHFWNSCCIIAFSAIIEFFRCLQYPEIFVILRQILVLETARSHSEPNEGYRVSVPFHYSFFGQKLFDIERLVSWSIAMWENPIVGPKFRRFSKHSLT
jgi:hypothetical protein